jgi:hypothetical protein
MTTDYRARAALSQPVPEGPTYEELVELTDSYGVSAEDIGPLVSTVLARWGRPAPEQGPTDQELYDVAEQFNGDPIPAMRRALELWGRPAVEPVPVSEWHEDIGDALWWRFPIEEPPYVGSPLDTDWPGYHTHFSLLPVPQEEADG